LISFMYISRSIGRTDASGAQWWISIHGNYTNHL